jgi:hypothetical protein
MILPSGGVGLNSIDTSLIVEAISFLFVFPEGVLIYFILVTFNIEKYVFCQL